MKWNKGEPPKTFTTTPVRIQFIGASCDGTEKKQTDSFVWFPRENAWSSVTDMDGYCLYPSDGYKILAWHN
jgi:hypothetical protein